MDREGHSGCLLIERSSHIGLNWVFQWTGPKATVTRVWVIELILGLSWHGAVQREKERAEWDTVDASRIEGSPMYISQEFMCISINQVFTLCREVGSSISKLEFWNIALGTPHARCGVYISIHWRQFLWGLIILSEFPKTIVVTKD